LIISRFPSTRTSYSFSDITQVTLQLGKRDRHKKLLRPFHDQGVATTERLLRSVATESGSAAEASRTLCPKSETSHIIDDSYARRLNSKGRHRGTQSRPDQNIQALPSASELHCRGRSTTTIKKWKCQGLSIVLGELSKGGGAIELVAHGGEYALMFTSSVYSSARFLIRVLRRVLQ